MAAPLCGAKPVERCLVQTSPCVRPGGTSHRPRPTQTRSRCHIPSVSTYACPCWTSHPAAARGVQARSFQPDTATATTSLAEAALLAKYQVRASQLHLRFSAPAKLTRLQAQSSVTQTRAHTSWPHLCCPRRPCSLWPPSYTTSKQQLQLDRHSTAQSRPPPQGGMTQTAYSISSCALSLRQSLCPSSVGLQAKKPLQKQKASSR